MNLFDPGPSAYERDLMGLLDQLGPDEIEELQAYFAHRTNSGRALSDHELAMSDFLHQVLELNRINEDMALARRIADGEDVVTAPPSPTRSPRNYHQRRVVVPTAPVITNRPTGHDCVVCQDPIHGTEIPAPCGDYYDIGCITTLFQSATRDEFLFPPRCCGQDIPFTLAQVHLPQALVTTFQQKRVEYSTLKRVYCFSPTCSRFLGPLEEDAASKVYVCPEPRCKKRTCGKCRQQHLGNFNHVCRPDAGAAQVLELGRTSGWARCPGCSHMVELMLGCFHMTCRCRTEFCYLCRALWKTCQCPQADEQYLVEGNNDVADVREHVDVFDDHDSDDDSEVEAGEPADRQDWHEQAFEEREEREVGEAIEGEEWQAGEPEAREFDAVEGVREDFDAGEVDQEVIDAHEEELPETQDLIDWRWEQERPDTDYTDEEAEREIQEEQEAQELVQWEIREADEEEPPELQETQEPQEWPWEHEDEAVNNEAEGVEEADEAEEEESAEAQDLYWGQDGYHDDGDDGDDDDDDDADDANDADDADEEELQSWGEPEEQEEGGEVPDDVQDLYWEQEEYDVNEAHEDVEPEMWEDQEEPGFDTWEGDDQGGYESYDAW